jgi:hypothetical protein
MRVLHLAGITAGLNTLGRLNHAVGVRGRRAERVGRNQTALVKHGGRGVLDDLLMLDVSHRLGPGPCLTVLHVCSANLVNRDRLTPSEIGKHETDQQDRKSRKM